MDKYERNFWVGSIMMAIPVIALLVLLGFLAGWLAPVGTIVGFGLVWMFIKGQELYQNSRWRW